LIEQSANATPEGFCRSFAGLSQQVLQFGEDLLNGIEIWTVRRQKQEPGSNAPDQFADDLSLVTAQIVHDDDIAWFERGQKEVLHIGQEPKAIDGAVKQAGSIDAVVAQSGDEGQRLPVPVRRFAYEA
jgi:hypothetical protein